MEFGRIHCFLVATKTGEVVYERFYDRLKESEKASVRGALRLASDNLPPQSDEQEFVGTYKNAVFVYIPTGDLVFYLIGSGEYEDIALSEILQVILQSLKDVLGKSPTAAVLFDKYSKLCLVVDEVVNEGLLEQVDRDVIRKGTKNKALWES